MHMAWVKACVRRANDYKNVIGLKNYPVTKQNLTLFKQGLTDVAMLYQIATHGIMHSH